MQLTNDLPFIGSPDVAIPLELSGPANAPLRHLTSIVIRYLDQRELQYQKPLRNVSMAALKI